MLKDEAKWLRQRLSQITPNDGPLLNIGSSSGHFREVVQPWIDELVFEPLRSRGCAIVHQDLSDAEGVDIVGDLLDPQCQQFIASQELGPILCSNVLEHVVDRQAFARVLTELLPRGAKLFVTVPAAFPYHPDPIDTMFRPSCAELQELFPDLKLLSSAIVSCGRLHNLVFAHPERALQKLLGKASEPHRAPHQELGTSETSLLAWLYPWAFVPFKMCCVELLK